MVLDSPPKAGAEEWRERHIFLKGATDKTRSVSRR
jgi:hypothetical protein